MSASTSSPILLKRVKVTFNHAKTTPRAAQKEIRLAALRIVNRFRQARTIDIAAGLFPDRTYKAALSAAQRSIGKLVRDKMLTRYRSLSGHTYYGLDKRGADLLQANAEHQIADGTAQASASRACEKTNPEHALWSAFAVLCSEARGLTALTEREFMPRFLLKSREGTRTFPVTYATPEGRTKGLMPDAIAFEMDGPAAFWFEIDRSARGGDRLDDLVGLVKKLGAEVSMGNGSLKRLRKVIILCKTPGILRRNRTHLTGDYVVAGERQKRIRIAGSSRPAIEEVANNVFNVFAELPVTYGDGRVAKVAQAIGQVHLQLLPTHLPGYSYRDGAAKGWFDDGSLPFRDDWPTLKGGTFL